MPFSAATYDQFIAPDVHGNAKRRLLTYITNAGTPVSAVVPQFIGQFCLNTTGSQFFIAVGLTSADWKAITA